MSELSTDNIDYIFSNAVDDMYALTLESARAELSALRSRVAELEAAQSENAHDAQVRDVQPARAEAAKSGLAE